jgi:hypothetical protein
MIAVQQEIIVSSVDKYASVSTRKSGSCTGPGIRKSIPAQSVTALPQGKGVVSSESEATPPPPPAKKHRLLQSTPSGRDCAKNHIKI